MSKPDQATLLKEHGELTARVATLEADIKAITAERDTVRGQLTNATELLDERNSTITELSSKLQTATNSLSAATSERDALKAEKRDFEASVAAEVCKRGVRGSGVPEPKVSQADSPQELLAQYEAVKHDPVKSAQFIMVNGAKIRAMIR